jgi:hypothetical protein
VFGRGLDRGDERRLARRPIAIKPPAAYRHRAQS